VEPRSAVAVGVPDELEQRIRVALNPSGYRVATVSPSLIWDVVDLDQAQGAFPESVDLLLLGSGLFSGPHNHPQDSICAGAGSCFVCIKSVLRGMIRRRFGRIVAIAPPLGSTPSMEQALRLALSGLTKTIAREVGSRGITANMVAPGFLEPATNGISPYVAAGRPGRLEEVAQVIAFLAGDGSTYVNGQFLAVDGGLS